MREIAPPSPFSLPPPKKVRYAELLEPRGQHGSTRATYDISKVTPAMSRALLSPSANAFYYSTTSWHPSGLFPGSRSRHMMIMMMPVSMTMRLFDEQPLLSIP